MGKMCKYCNDLTIQVECTIWAMAVLVLFVAFISYVYYEGHYDTFRFILLGALGFGTIAGLCFLLGAVLSKRYLLLAWIVLICPVFVVAVVMSCLILHETWNSIDDLYKARMIVGLILLTCLIVYLVYLSCLLVLELKTGQRQKRYPDCVGGRYPRGAVRERSSDV